MFIHGGLLQREELTEMRMMRAMAQQTSVLNHNRLNHSEKILFCLP